MSEELAIEVAGLLKSFGDTHVLKGIDLRVPTGGVHALLGPNGAGKTTTVRVLSTLSAPDGGVVRVAGHDVRRERSAVRRRISVTGQYAALDEAQSGRENLWTIGRLRGLGRRTARERAAELLASFDLRGAADRPVAVYSGGMRRRLDIAAALVGGRPQVLFLDEPTTGLDPRSRRTTWETVAELARQGVTVFLTTQYLEEADRLAERVTLLDRGRIVAEGSPAELKHRVAARRLELTAASPAAHEELRRRLRVAPLHDDPPGLRLSVATDGAAAEVRALLDRLDPTAELVVRFHILDASLDDVFLSLTGRDAQPVDTHPKETGHAA
ncbi:ATP-binding cassette domain-containing protein [Streptomyces alkaliterrae]|uniref:ABC-type xenobiotic transporter n=1 Tax=Streptomyces alkaliterrae TaxID=2213162 RepID=A0A5P0YXD0_9ACTN|nr:ATP-binding cassette domain-containing protein [Streptomyces alkaliterrae]MBB1256523.1 ATP-binding cassette domain-containing protein [Streptomyces alkaliterrae]MBB1258349.1 ATP-binding cassette domain-containing protein [Streptomyces alkaliterrae]MQS04944.1 ATP-binding cassette domain-containing protein [Streptomyces alkaliterrae]